MKLCPVCGTQNHDAAATCENPDCQYGFDSSMNSQKTELFEKQQVFFSDGSFIAERYEIVRELGRGGMGVVYLVKDSKLRGREVALKMTHPELISHDEARQRFIDEVLLCLDLHHPNIVIVHPLEDYGDQLFFTMEYISGQSLRELMDKQKGTIPPFTLEETIQVINPILDALSYAHQTTIHRDIKPENIMILGNFPDIQVKVLDFGIAKVLSASRFTRTAQSMGTAYYMSPEQMKGAKHIDHRSDIYSVGMILYEMLIGEIAAGRFKLPGELVKGIPESIDILIDKTLSPKPDDRLETALEMKTILLDVLQTTSGKIGPKAQEKTPKPLPEKEKAWSNTISQVSKEPGTFVNDFGMKFVWVSPGTFTMGSPSTESGRFDRETQHQVTLTKGYYMMTTQVTQGQWTAVMGSNPSNFKGDTLPVETVSWDDAQEFTKRLNNKGGKITYRLPTEAEWEYAARAGGSYKYSGSDNIDSVAWYDGNTGRKTHPVGLKTPNAYGLYDMSGNVWEWCQDWKADYPSGSVTDPDGPSFGYIRVGRGGGWGSGAGVCRSAHRFSFISGRRNVYLGFRLAGH